MSEVARTINRSDPAASRFSSEDADLRRCWNAAISSEALHVDGKCLATSLTNTVTGQMPRNGKGVSRQACVTHPLPCRDPILMR